MKLVRLSPSPAPEQTVCETGVSWPSLVTEQDKGETGVSSPGPSTNPTHPRSPTRDSWNNSWDRYDCRDKWTDVWKDGHDGNRWIHGWNEYYHGDVWTDAWRERNSGFVCQHNDDNSTDAWNKCKPDDEWRASHWGNEQLELEPLGDERMERYRRVQQRSQGTDAVKSFIFRGKEHEPVDQLSLSGAMTLPHFLALRSIPVSRWLTLLHRVESSMSALFGRPKRLFSTNLASNHVSSLATTKQWALEAEPRCWERLRCPPAWEVSTV